MYKLERIQIGDNSYPYIIDLNVLEALQEEFGTVQAFERLLLGLVIVKDENGETVYKEDGTPKMLLTEPSLKAINFALVEMVNEGVAVEKKRTGEVFEPIDGLDIMAECDTDYHELAELIHAEFVRRFESKKSKPTKSRVRKRTQ